MAMSDRIESAKPLEREAVSTHEGIRNAASASTFSILYFVYYDSLLATV